MPTTINDVDDDKEYQRQRRWKNHDAADEPDADDHVTDLGDTTKDSNTCQHRHRSTSTHYFKNDGKIQPITPTKLRLL